MIHHFLSGASVFSSKRLNSLILISFKALNSLILILPYIVIPVGSLTKKMPKKFYSSQILHLD